jgi:hypothetical protein
MTMPGAMRPLLWLAMILFAGSASAQTDETWKPLVYAQGPADNPLKGFIPYKGVYTTFPYSMEWWYIPWKDIQSGDSTFTWKPIDDLLAEVSARGHQVVFRVYADYPKKPYAVPQFLDSIPKHSYTDFGNTISYSPDYDNPTLRRAMLNTIAALGARYDGDPRIGFIQVGFLGFWGEWHTYPHTDWFASAATQNAVLDAFESAFHRTKIQMREPKPGTNMPARAIGYHDDSFCYSTFGTVAGAGWYFWPKLVAAGESGKWRTGSIGGELRPEIQLTLWNTACVCTAGESNLAMQYFDQCVDSTHASWLLVHNVFSSATTGDAYARAVAGARRLGYDLFVSASNVPANVATDSITIMVKMQNKGVAPFPYDWYVDLAMVDDARVMAGVWRTPWALTTVIDSTTMHFSNTHSVPGLTPGTYTLLMRAVNPMHGGKPLVFANAEWAKDVPGWLTLGTFRYYGPTGAVSNTSSGLPEVVSLAQNFPNPFNPVTTIRYGLPWRAKIVMTVYDLLGRVATVLDEGMREPGQHDVRFNGVGQPSGVYFCRLQVDRVVDAGALGGGVALRDDEAGRSVKMIRVVLTK